MSTVRCVVHPGWIEVAGPDVHAVVAAADRHAEALGAAAAEGLLALLEALTAHGLAGAPDFAAAAPTDSGVRVVVRGAATVVLPDGSRLGSQGRMPWADHDVDVADDAEVVLEAPEPQAPRGWRRPARLARAAAGDVAPATVEPAPEVATPAEDDPSARGTIDQLVDLAPGDVGDEPEQAGRPGQPAEPEQAVESAEPEQSGGPGEPEEPAAAPAPAEPAVPQPDLTLPPPDDSMGLPPVARVPATPPPRSGLIDAVPWRRPGGAPQPAPTTGEADAVPPAGPNPTELLPVTPPATTTDDPHHGEPQGDPTPALPARAETLEVPAATVVDSPASGAPAPDLTTDRGALPRAEEDLDRPVVLAVLCPAGHPSPPHAGRCRTCGREIPPQQPFPTPRPSLGVLRISTGGSVPLDRGVLLGRAPRVNEELPPNQRPHLLRVGGADRDISRNHAEVVLEGWHVLVRDLGSTNGTTVTLPGQEPVRLRPTEDQGIEPGTVVTLADEVVLTYEVEE